MHCSQDLKQLLQTLVDCDDQSTDALKILSRKLDKSILSKNEITFEEQAEGIVLDLSIQNILIYKNKQDAVTYIKIDDEEKTILIIEEQLVYKTGLKSNCFFSNLFFSIKIKNLFLRSKIVSYHDEINKKLIFLSEQIGKVEVGYKNQLLDFCNGNYDLSYENINTKFNEKEYLSFFRDNFIKTAKEYDNSANRFYLALMRISIIFENSNREFELYKNKFSFEKFHSNLEKEKEKYIKDIQENLFEFQSKVNSLPIQFGVYIFLVFRFQNGIIPLIAVIILIITWSVFTLYLLNIMKKGVDHTKQKIVHVFEQISKKSGINVSNDKIEIDNIILKIQRGIKWFRCIIIIFSIILITFSCSNIYSTYEKNEYQKTLNNHKKTIIKNVLQKVKSKTKSLNNKKD